MTATTLISGIRKRGGDLFLDGDSVRFRGAEHLLTEKLLAALRGRKEEIAEILASEPPPTPEPAWVSSGSLTLEEFAGTSRVVRLYSEVLGEEVIFAGDGAVFDPPPGVMVYRAAELETYLGCTPEKLRELHDLKKQFSSEDFSLEEWAEISCEDAPRSTETTL